MGRINVLDKHVAELIAAGEVVERPSSVIKELVENAIDAGADSVTVEIKNGGVTYMRVTDNGCGIARDDVPKAFLRHATSKVRLQDDLDKIGTLGFRGEALASVCAVSRVELMTCSEDETLGTRYCVSGGEKEALEDAGCPKGTTIIVRDLFYNVPARMKFLKKDVSEANAVANVMDKIALSHPEVAFTFLRDGKQALKTTGDKKLLTAIYSVYGREFANGLMPVGYSLNGVAVNGYVSRPVNARPNRNMQNFFINGRFVKSRTAMAAVEEACKGSVMVGKFPACVLHIEISCEAVDVNVHPAKIEVRFINERPVFDAVYHAVKSALLEKDETKVASFLPKQGTGKKSNLFEIKPELPKQESGQDAFAVLDTQQFKDKGAHTAPVPEKPAVAGEEEPQMFLPKKHSFGSVPLHDSVNPFDLYKGVIKVNRNMFNANAFDMEEEKPEPPLGYDAYKEAHKKQESGASLSGEKAKTEQTEREELPVLAEQEAVSTRFIGEAFQTYIIMEKGPDELLLIDKHAAHERLIYEKLKKDKGKGCAQYLLEPVKVTLSKLEYDAVLQNTGLLDEAGFEISDFGAGMVLVRSAPQYLTHDDIEPTIIEMAGYLLQNKNDINSQHMDWIYHNVSCRAAIKAGNLSHPQELIDLARQLEEDKAIRYCPHGRPISIIIKRREIEKQFGRV